jgi:hypothetical protein
VQRLKEGGEVDYVIMWIAAKGFFLVKENRMPARTEELRDRARMIVATIAAEQIRSCAWVSGAPCIAGKSAS